MTAPALRILFLAMISCSSLRADSSASLLVPLSAELTYEEGGRLLIRADERSKDLKIVELNVNGQKMEVPAEELKELRNPDLGRSIVLAREKDPESGENRWYVEIKYGYTNFAWGTGECNVRFWFSSKGYLFRETKVPTEKDTWETRTKKKGEAEVKDGVERVHKAK